MRLLVTFASLGFSSLVVACGGQVTGSDGGTTQADGGICVDLEPSAFDTSCNADPDCVGIAAGSICSGYTCICPSATINANSQAAYEAMLSKVPQGSGQPCGCPAFGAPRCISSQCVFCPNPALKPPSYPPGCPDGG